MSARSQAEMDPISVRGRRVPTKQRIRWEWNIPLLIRSVSLLAVIGIIATALYLWQSSRIASEILAQAKNSEERGEFKEQVKWLSRYVRLVPNDVESLASFAFAIDSQPSTGFNEVEFARKRLSIALVACGDSPQFEQLRSDLRRKLIPRLLQLGSGKAVEAEKQILLLSATERDAEVLKWISQSLYLQRTDSEYQVRDASQYDKELDYWNWLASQPTGQVLRMAVEANPDDVDLAARLLSVCNQHPSWFSPTNEALPKQQIEELANQTLEKLAVKKNDGHAQLAVYYYTDLSDQVKAKSILGEALEPALLRLTDNLGSRAPSATADGSKAFASTGAAGSPSVSGRSQSDYVPYWDWQIALESSGIAGGEETERICSRLIELASEKVAPKQREDAFLQIAARRMEQGEYVAAIEICKSGIASVQQSSALNGLMAVANLRLERTEEASQAIQAIETDAETRLKQLDGAQGLGMSTVEKDAARTQIADDQWKSRLLRGHLALIEKDFVRASRLLKDAYQTTMSISVENRLEAGRLLAVCYSQTEQWDLVGQVLGECSVLRPNDTALRMSAAEAWARAGAQERASEQIAGADDGSFFGALATARLADLAQSSKPTSQVNWDLVRGALKTARNRLDAVPIEERSSLEPWRLELLELRYRSDDVKSSREQDQDSLSKLEEIAERYADVSAVQSQAALDLAAFGRLDAANLAISRLEQIAARTHSVFDRAEVVLTQARVKLVKNDMAGALSLLDSAIKSIPEESLRFAKAAARVELRETRIEAAYDRICSVPEEKLDFDAIALVAGIADALKDVNAVKADELIDKLERWITRLKETEGDNGTNWRYLAAERLIAKLATETNSSPLLEQASRYFSEIDSRRPRWGLAATLGARIASIKGDSEEAIGLWRRAIRDGDNRVSTVLDLVRELNHIKRGDQAELELQRISGFADSVVPVSALAISFALKRGDFSEALKRAEQLTIKNPDEVDGWLLRAQTAFAASSGLGLDEASQSKLRDDSWTFLDKAHSLSMGKNIAVWDARFRFKLLTGGKTLASEIIEELLSSPLPDEVRLNEAGRRYLTLKEYGLARTCFENSLLLNPRSVEAHFGMADLQNAIGDNEEGIKSLRKAHQAAPSNQSISERLALNLAFSKNEKIDWNEIDSLLSSTTNPRSTLVRALIGLSRGDKTRQAKAEKTLRDLSQSSTPERDDAKRLLANYFALQWSVNSRANKTETAIENFESARRLYEELLDESATNPSDAARYVNLLLNFDESEKESKVGSTVDYLAIVDRALTKLESATGSSVASLQLRIRLAKARGDEATIGKIADKWVEDAGDLESLGTQNLWEITGQTLMELGHSEQSITWLERVYEKDPKKYGLLAIALAREKKYERAIELCVTAYKSDPSAVAATLIASVAMMQTEASLPADASQILKDALTKFSNSAELYEAMGTLQLMQHRLPEAVSFYETAEKNDPKGRRTLNNLAMALSEMPMRKQDALAKIQRAIEIHGRDPDLLDTLGQVQFRIGRLQEGLDALTEACNRKDDISFRVHLAQVLMAQKDLAGAKEQWTKIKQSKSEGAILTPEDKEFLKLLNSQFGEELK